MAMLVITRGYINLSQNGDCICHFPTQHLRERYRETCLGHDHRIHGDLWHHRITAVEFDWVYGR